MNKIEQAIATILSTSLSDHQKQQALLLVCTTEQSPQKTQFKPTKNPPQDTFVYLIENEQGHIKIGFSGNPEKRLSQLKTGCPSAKLLHKFIGTMQDEKHLQSLFSGKNIDKEWFRLNGGDIEDIRGYFNKKEKYFIENNIGIHCQYCNVKFQIPRTKKKYCSAVFRKSAFLIENPTGKKLTV